MQKESVAEILSKALAKKKINLKSQEILERIEIPPSSEMGDFAFPCFFLASSLKMNPAEIALEIREQIGKIPSEFQDIQTKGPYINFFVNRGNLAADIIQEIFEKKDTFGSKGIGKGKKMLVEHTSINPNASPHVGRARNAIIGDSLVRILKFQGFNVDVHYYVNDVSKQIAMLVLAGAEKLKFESMLKKYVKISAEVKKSKKKEQQVFDLLEKFESGDEETTKKFNKVTSTCVKGQESILGKLGISYDVFDYESAYLKKSKEILAQLEKSGKLFQDEEGRIVLDLKNTSVEGKMRTPLLVLTRSNATGLYPLRDIAYTLDKMKKADSNLIVLGEDQKLYFNQIAEALKILGSDFPKVVHYSYILLSEGKKKKKMSTRKGEVVLLEDFLADAIKKAEKKSKKKSYAKTIGTAAVRYVILKNSADKIINFNLDDALNFEGDTGPYLLYSYARASSILRKIKENKKIELKYDELEPQEIELIKKFAEFPEIVLKSYNNSDPSYIANYSYKLAQAFSDFYQNCPVMKSKNEKFRILLVKSFRQVLKNSLGLLGIDVLEEM